MLDTILCCPACGAADLHEPVCSACGYRVDVDDGLIDLRTDKDYDTFLDSADYDAAHGITGAPDPTVFQQYRDFLAGIGISTAGTVLEIACGSGQLTASMVLAGDFDAIHCGDISPAFMQRLMRRVEAIDSTTRVDRYLFDANRLPFADQSVDFVFGNSVLHHFAEFERTLADARRVLKPGGAACFGEPMMDGHIYVALAAGLIHRAAEVSGDESVTPRHLRALKIMSARPQKKMGNLHGDRSQLRDIEDKFQFPAQLLQDLGPELGYSRVHVERAGADYDLGGMVRHRMERVFRNVNVSPEPLERYAYVFAALTEDLGRPLTGYIHPYFSKIAFVR